MHGAGIQDPNSFDRLVADHMGVTVEKVVGAGLEATFDLRGKMAVGRDDPAAAHPESSRRVMWPEFQCGCIGGERSFFVDVPEEEVHRKAGQPVDHRFAADIAEMEDGRRARVEESIEGGGGSFGTAVGVGEQSEASVRKIDPVVHVVSCVSTVGRAGDATPRANGILSDSSGSVDRILRSPTFSDRKPPMTVVTRFAPSPSGSLHVGGARTALFCWAFARGRAGRFLLRIEDTDRKRSSEAASLGFMTDLDWLGIGWDEGPVHGDQGGGDHGPYFQSERLPVYTELLERLVAEGKAYHAFDTPAELDAKRKAAREAKQAYRYDRVALELPAEEVAAKLAAGEPSVIRFRTPDAPITIVDEVLGEATLPEGEVDDFVIRKADGFPTYHFAVVVDDAMMKVSHVLRAQEHFNNTAKHIVLQDALGFERPVYGHLSLIFNPDGSKMSKRDKDKTLRAAVRERGIDSPPVDAAGEPVVPPEAWTSWLGDKTVQLELASLEAAASLLGVALPEINVADFRRSGYLPEALCNFLALNGWSAGDDLEKFDLDFLSANFGLDRVQKTPAKFDRDKLLAFNLDAIQAMDADGFHDRARAHAEVFHPVFLERLDDAQFRVLCDASRERSKTLDEPFRTNRFLVAGDDEIEWTVNKPVRKAMFKGEPTGLALLESILPSLEASENFDAKTLETMITAFAENHAEGNLGRIAQPLRIAVSGGPVSPPIFDTLAILGRDAVVARIRACLAALAAEG